MPARTSRFLFIARIPTEGVSDFQAYEAAVLAVLPEHGARLEQRFRSADGCVEVHVLDFPSAAALDAYRADPRRTDVQPLLERSGAAVELHPLADD